MAEARRSFGKIDSRVRASRNEATNGHQLHRRGAMASATANAPVAREYVYYRHTLPVRIMHWINVVALTILLMSGLQIFNSHPALYWGKSSYAGAPPLLEMRAMDRGDLGMKGVTRVLGRDFDTTGVLGLSKNA